MAVPVLMPKFGQTMTEGTIMRWEKKVGDFVRKGEILLKIETDKAEMDVESDESGYLLAIAAKEGELLPCGQAIAWLGEKGEEV